MASFTEWGNDLYTGRVSINFVGRRAIWYAIAAVLIAISILVPVLRGGFVFGIEFTGGSQFEVSGVGAEPDQTIAQDAVASVVSGANARVTVVGGESIRIQTDQLTSRETDSVREELVEAYGVDDDQVTSSFIGPVWGQDITNSSIRAILIFLGLAAIVMALYFRTWKMSLAALLALAHDLILTAGVYGIFGFEVTPAAMIGFLTILGYSIYDTVVVFDKVRENTSEDEGSSTRTFAQSVNLAVNQTLVRSINTSVVAVLPVGSILLIGSVLLGAGTLRDIALALFVGMIVGTYSTIFLAAPIYAHLRSGEAEIVKNDQRVLATQRKAAVTA